MIRLALALLACRRPTEGDGPGTTPAPPPTTPPTTTTPPTPPGDPVTIGALTFRTGVPKNLLVVSIDTVRRDRIGRWSGLTTTPFMDGWLGGAVVLDHHRSCSNWTAPSLVCALAGWFPVNHGFWPNSGDPLVPPMPDGLETLAVLAHRAGYRTELVTTNPVFSGEEASLVAGFDEVELHGWWPAEEVAADAVSRATDLVAAGAPFYLHLHLMDLHDPYCPPPGYDAGTEGLPDPGFEVCGELAEVIPTWQTLDAATRAAAVAQIDAAYRNEVRYVDDVLADLLGDLDGAGALDDTLVVLFTDHGEQFDERGWLRHGNDLYAEENLAFAALWARDLDPVAWNEPTWHPDLAATVARVFGWRSTRPLDGDPVGLAAPARVTPYAGYFAPSPFELGVATNDRALLYDWAGGRAHFRTDVDPAERTDVYDAADPDVIALWDAMGPLVDSVAAAFPHFGPAVDAAP